jgi:regulator of PEP synthase PpsR (kinase-PPPase family)
MKRTAFFISDSTGITAEVMVESLLSHFPSIEFERHSFTYVDNEEKARAAADTINAAALSDGQAPVVFDTLISETLRNIITASNGYCVDVINTFLSPLEKALGAPSSYTVGRPKIATQSSQYNRRIEAVHFALDNDDGGRVNRYNEADVILIGVSRSGKTPSCLYLALQFGIYAANFPITEEDLETASLPKALVDYKDRLFGLTIGPDRLASIRSERLSGSRYASSRQCEREVQEALTMFERFKIPYIDTTDCSIEEISTRILAETGIERKFK